MVVPEAMSAALRRGFAVLLLPLSVVPVVLLGPSLLRAPATLWHELEGRAGVSAPAKRAAHATAPEQAISATHPSMARSHAHSAHRAGAALKAGDRAKRDSRR
jgi:hypothetical protein